MIYTNPKQVVRRYGRTGWKVIADNGCLQMFFSRRGDWTMFDDSCSGANCTDWESHGDEIWLNNPYIEVEAKIKRKVLDEIIANLRNWMGS